MPRRKKKSTVERKPSLIFTESPVNIQNNVLSPVLCARHPPTASSIPIENLNLSWVSPQFRHITSSGGGRRLRNTRQRRHSVAAHGNFLNSHRLDNKENHLLPNHTNKLKKFNSLKFVGERTCASILEDVEITADTDTGTDDEHVAENRISLISSPNRGTIHVEDSHGDETNTVDNQLNDNSSGDDLKTHENVELNHIHPFKVTAPVKRLFASQLKINPGSRSETSLMNKLITNDKIGNKGLGQIQSQTVSESEEESPVLLRRSTRIKQLHALLNISDSPYRSIGGHTTILAPDTPENEYGWSKRKRQLIKYINKTS